MSGIVGIINLDGGPIDRSLLQRMTDFLSFRGPDATTIHVDGHLGLGHTLLRTTEESRNEHQPLTLNGKVWLTADARIDGRADLIQELKSAGREDVKAANDAELLLHAYHTWGEDCVKHLLGDFAFAIWDGEKRKLFCVRDHFGVKPFFYARISKSLIFSNTLNCMRLHPDISSTLNDHAIADFLLFDSNQNPSTTFFADIHRLPPAHTLVLRENQFSISRYWTLPRGGHIRYKKSSEYVEHFNEIFRTAVNDRLRTGNVAISMSGGLDSPSVAAIARDLLSQNAASFDLQAHTIVYDRLIPDKERYYSGLAAKALGIPVNYIVADDYKLYERWEQREIRGPEPSGNVFSAITADQLRQISAHTRVALTGFGGDPLFRYLFTPHTRLLLKNGHLVQALNDIWKYARLDRGTRLIMLPRIKRLFRNAETTSPYPLWLNHDFERERNLQRHFEQGDDKQFEDHPRGQAYGFMKDSMWMSIFEAHDPGVICQPLETRHPFFDLRLIDYVWSIPGVPWCLDKTILRKAMRGLLPEAVRRRPKAPLAGDLLFAYLKEHPEDSTFGKIAPELAKYVDLEAFKRVKASGLYDRYWINLRPLTLNRWLTFENLCGN